MDSVLIEDSREVAPCRFEKQETWQTGAVNRKNREARKEGRNGVVGGSNEFANSLYSELLTRVFQPSGFVDMNAMVHGEAYVSRTSQLELELQGGNLHFHVVGPQCV